MKIARHTAKVNFRVPEIMLKKIEKKSLKKKQSVAEYLRELIEKDFSLAK